MGNFDIFHKKTGEIVPLESYTEAVEIIMQHRREYLFVTRPVWQPVFSVTDGHYLGYTDPNRGFVRADEMTTPDPADAVRLRYATAEDMILVADCLYTAAELADKLIRKTGPQCGLTPAEHDELKRQADFIRLLALKYDQDVRGCLLDGDRCNLLDDGAADCEMWQNGGCTCPGKSREGCGGKCPAGGPFADKLNEEVA